MIKFARPARRRRRLALMRARRPTIQQERRWRGEWKRAWKEERDFARNSERCYPGLRHAYRETVALAVGESDRSGSPVVHPIILACRAMERYLTGECVGPLVRGDNATFVNSPFSQEMPR